jgi:restriction endonuclease S subunit
MGWRPKEQKIINKIIQDIEDLADAEIERLVKHIEFKRKKNLSCC